MVHILRPQIEFAADAGLRAPQLAAARLPMDLIDTSKFRARRAALGLTQQQVAWSCEKRIHQTSVSACEKGAAKDRYAAAYIDRALAAHEACDVALRATAAAWSDPAFAEKRAAIIQAQMHLRLHCRPDLAMWLIRAKPEAAARIAIGVAVHALRAIPADDDRDKHAWDILSEAGLVDHSVADVAFEMPDFEWWPDNADLLPIGDKND